MMAMMWSDGENSTAGAVTMFALSILSKLVISRILQQSSDSNEFELKKKYIDEFIRTGIVVIPNILKDSEIRESRRRFHNQLRTMDVDPDRLHETASGLAKMSSTGGAGGILDIFYAKWKLSLNEHPDIVSAYISLLSATYAAPTPSALWKHPYEKFHADDVFMYIDRCCFRVRSQKA